MTALRAETSRLYSKADGNGDWKIPETLAVVKWPAGVRKASRMSSTAGMRRKNAT
ncbi:MAG: hypothetical protein M0Z42_24465 [Actinomycetota bacterium]|jgi:hypothetical protein|nr:hypothetical protein [Actinomycetota bacterium]